VIEAAILWNEPSNESHRDFELDPHWSYEATERADALLVATEWRPVREPDFERLRRLLENPVIFDARNLHEPREMRELGFTHHCIGRAAR